MPGIVGIIGKGLHGKHEDDLKLMLDCTMHEPFYRRGSYTNEELGVYIGWTCHPNSYADCMPAMNERKDVVLIFSGEHFSNHPIRDHFKANDLVRQYEMKGEEFFRDLNGWFSGVIIDFRTSKVTLFNDRYGMHRIYYHEGKEAFLFSSEAKSLLSVRASLRNVDMRGLGELISCNCVLENRTLFSGISLLPGGASWSWENSTGMRKGSYFKASDWEALPPMDGEVFNARLKDTLLRIMPRYFQGDGRVGISITGGLDSRSMMACLDPRPGELPCYTFGGAKDVLDISIARQVAGVCGQSYEVIRLGREFFSAFPRFAEKTLYVTDGGLDVCSAHDMYFNELARRIAPTRVTGKFGSEVVRDHSMFNAGGCEERLFSRDFSPFVAQGIDTLNEVKKGHQLSVAVFKDFPWREYTKIMLEQSQMIFRSPYMDNELVELMYQAPVGVRASNESQRRIIRECNPGLSAIITDRGYSENANPLAAKLIEAYYYALFKADYTYLFALPHWMTRLDSMLKAVGLGQRILGEQKFEGYRMWFRDELSSYVKEILLDHRTLSRPYCDKKALEDMVYKHTKGTHNYMNEINKAMSIELMHRMLIDRTVGQQN